MDKDGLFIPIYTYLHLKFSLPLSDQEEDLGKDEDKDGLGTGGL